MSTLSPGVSMDAPLARYGFRARPFQPGSDRAFLWLGGTRKEMLEALRSAVLRREGLLILTGEVGSGKTLLAHALLADLDDAALVARVPYPELDPIDWFTTLAGAWRFGSVPDARPSFLRRVAEFADEAAARGRIPLVVIDEAQNLRPELFTEIEHLLSLGRRSGRGVSVLLVGQRELDTVLGAPGRAALRGLIGVRRDLRPVAEEEVADYVRHRLRIAGCDRPLFTPEALREVATASHGIPRLINSLCNLALWSAARGNLDTIDGALVRECADRLGPLQRARPPCDADPEERPVSAPVPTPSRAAARSVRSRRDADREPGAMWPSPPVETRALKPEPAGRTVLDDAAREDRWLVRGVPVGLYVAGLAFLVLLVSSAYLAGWFVSRGPDKPKPEPVAAVAEDVARAGPAPTAQRELAADAVGGARAAIAADTPTPSPTTSAPSGPAPAVAVPAPPTGTATDVPSPPPPPPTAPRLPSLPVPPGPGGAARAAQAAARPPEGALEGAEADPGAIIDWLLQEYPARRR